MGRSPCCDGTGLKKGPWTPEEDKKLVEYIQKNGHGSWRALPKLSGLNRCGKSCRLRWTNYLRPDIKRGKFTEDEDRLIIRLHSVLGNKWSAIATRLPGRTDNEIKNYWNTHLRKKLLQMGIDPVTHRQRSDLNLLANLPSLLAASNLCNLANPWDNALRLQADAAQLARIQLLQSVIQVLSTNSPANLDAINLVGSGILRNYQSSDLFQMNNQSQALFDTALGLPQGTAGQNTLNPSNVGTTQWPNEFQSLAESSISVDDKERISQINSSCVNSSLAVDHPTIGSTANSTPSLVSAMDQMQDQINANEVCVNSFKSDDVFVPWEELNLDEPIGDFNWKDVLDKMTLPTWSITT